MAKKFERGGAVPVQAPPALKNEEMTLLTARLEVVPFPKPDFLEFPYTCIPCPLKN